MVTHHFLRTFQPDKLHAPRDFQPLGGLKSSLLSEPLGDFFNQTVCLEIGAGKGKHAIEYAQSHPDERLIAIERTKEKFSAFFQRVQDLQKNQSLDNLYCIHADAIAWVVHAIPPNCLDKVFILYPNPEPHNANQRWLNMPFFEFLLSRLKVNGSIILASNILSYIEEAEQQASNVWQVPVIKQLVPKDSQRTHFEMKYLARGQLCWQLILTKPVHYQTHFDTWSSHFISS